jgi:hypothetical protein
MSSYFSKLGFFTLLDLSTSPVITWESNFNTALSIPIAFSFLSPNNKASYPAIMFVLWNCNLIAYVVFTLEGDTIIAAALALNNPHEPLQKKLSKSFRLTGLLRLVSLESNKQ